MFNECKNEDIMCFFGTGVAEEVERLVHKVAGSIPGISSYYRWHVAQEVERVGW